MFTVTDVIASPALTGFYFDDQLAIKKGARENGSAYEGETATAGFKSVRQAGEAISIEFILADGQRAGGDCAAVQYSGAAGRDPLFLSQNFIPLIEEKIRPLLLKEGPWQSFKEMAQRIENIEIEGKKLHTALRYGLTQAALDAMAKAQKKSRTEVIVEEYDLDLNINPIDIFCQTGDDRYLNADKAIIKRVDVLPHALINNIEDKLGNQGKKLISYLEWLVERIQKLGEPGYQPIIHIDVYGTIGEAFSQDREAIIDYILQLEKAAGPHTLRLEGPVDAGSRAKQLEVLADLTARLTELGSKVEIVADEWCNTLADIKEFARQRAGHMIQIKTPDLGGIHNTIEAVLFCRQQGIGAYQGGTCNETDRSARICTDIALATRPDQILAKPGMGVDEGLMIVNNQMQRTLKYLEQQAKDDKND